MSYQYYLWKKKTFKLRQVCTMQSNCLCHDWAITEISSALVATASEQMIKTVYFVYCIHIYTIKFKLLMRFRFSMFRVFNAHLWNSSESVPWMLHSVSLIVFLFHIRRLSSIYSMTWFITTEHLACVCVCVCACIAIVFIWTIDFSTQTRQRLQRNYSRRWLTGTLYSHPFDDNYNFIIQEQCWNNEDSFMYAVLLWCCCSYLAPPR